MINQYIKANDNEVYAINKDTGMGYVSNDYGKRFITIPKSKPKRFIRQEFKYLSRKRG